MPDHEASATPRKAQVRRVGPQPNGWCSLRVRFDDDELVLLRAAERLYGAELARQGRPQALRQALTLAKAGRKIATASAGVVVSLDEPELRTFAEALRFAAERVLEVTSVELESLTG